MRPFLAIAGLLMTCAIAAPSLAQGLAASTQPLPEPIYWAQDIFIIPYQWSSRGDHTTASQVILYLSKDRGANWTEVTRARPEVRSFQYRAAGDGEYWFSVRTLDDTGRMWPTGKMTPELRVVVDTQIPTIVQLAGQADAAGRLQVTCEARDANLDPAKFQLAARVAGSRQWTQLTAANVATVSPGVIRATTFWQPPSAGVVELRAAVEDLAGNPAGAGTSVNAPLSMASSSQGTAPRTVGADAMRSVLVPSRDPFLALTPPPSAPPAGAWNASQPQSPAPSATASTDSPPASTGQAWQADATASVPFRADDPLAWRSAAEPSRPRIAARGSLDNSPYRTASTGRGSAAAGSARSISDGGFSAAGQRASTYSGDRAVGAEVLLVNQSQFALDYDLESVGNWGVSKVEVWGTRNGGQTWKLYADDSDRRSPVNIDTPGPGRYGFRILVEGVGSLPVEPPRPGDAPEIQVAVDLEPPVARLTSVAQGTGYLGDHLVIQWQAEDAYLESRPVSLSYSSGPAGPWVPIAANLENSAGGGRYEWRLQRHLPNSLYVRMEVRDRAGNKATAQTEAPVPLDFSQPAGRIRSVRPLGGF